MYNHSKKKIMNRILLTITCIFASFNFVFSQVNFDFEIWKAPERAIPFDWSEPENWTSTNRLTEFINPGITQTSDAHEGNAAVLISSMQIFGINTASSLVLGRGVIDFPNKSILLDKAGLPLEQKLASVSAWYKYENTQNIGAGQMEIYITRWEPNDITRTILVYQTVDLPISSEYKQINVSVDVADFSIQSDTVIMVFHSDRDADLSLGTGKLTVDDVKLSYVSNTVQIDPSHPMVIHPNPVSNKSSISFNTDMPTSAIINLYNLHGRVVVREKTETNSIQLSPSISPGLYFMEIWTDHGRVISKVVITE
jgi:hypothetical protein